MATIQGIYIALFGRPADPLGLAYFEAETNGGADLTAIGDLAATAEYQNRFEGMSNVEIVNSIYQSLYGRDADLAGLTFFVNALQDGTYNINNIAIAILDGAQGNDAAILANKLEAANLFTESLDTGSEVVAYQGDDAAAAGRAFLSGVTSDDATVPTQAEVDAAIEAIVDTDQGGGVGSTFTLTDQVGEIVTGTAAGDTFNGVLDAGTPGAAGAGTFNTGDQVNGGAGEDTLNITTITGGAVLPPGASVSGVEIVNVNQSAATATGITSASFAGVEQLWQIDNSAAGGTYGGVTVSAGVTAGFRSTGSNASAVDVGATTAGVVVTAASATQKTVDVALDGTGAAYIDIAGAGVETVTVSGRISEAAATNVLELDDNGGGSPVETLNLGLTSNTTVDLTTAGAFASLKTIDASESTGALSFGRDLDLADEELVIIDGSGNDTITSDVDAGTAAATLNITLSGGDDAVVFAGAGTGNLFAAGDADDLAESLVTVEGFAAADDVINISGLSGGIGGAKTAQNVVDAAISSATVDDLFDITDAVADVTAVDSYSLFEYEGSTYVFYNDATAGLDAGDTLIQITGVSVSDLNGDNFIA